MRTSTSVLLLGAKRILVVMVGRLPSLALPASRRWILKQPTVAFFQHPPRSVGALDRAPQVLEPSSRFDHEGLTGKQVLSMP